MASIDKTKALKMPVLDCLMDDDPGSKEEAGRPAKLLLEQLKESVRRDLENLFNTRRCCVSPPEDLAELSSSLLNYGLPDLATINLESSAEVNDFCATVESSIQHFEPRIRKIKIHANRGLDTTDSFFRFRVEAVLYASPADETIIFDSALDPISQSVLIKESLR